MENITREGRIFFWIVILLLILTAVALSTLPCLPLNFKKKLRAEINRMVLRVVLGLAFIIVFAFVASIPWWVTAIFAVLLAAAAILSFVWLFVSYLRSFDTPEPKAKRALVSEKIMRRVKSVLAIITIIAVVIFLKWLGILGLVVLIIFGLIMAVVAIATVYSVKNQSSFMSFFLKEPS